MKTVISNTTSGWRMVPISMHIPTTISLADATDAGLPRCGGARLFLFTLE